MSGGLSTTAFIAAAASTAAAAASIGTTIAGAVGGQGAKDALDPLSLLNKQAQSNQSARSQLLATAGGGAGDPLQPGGVSNTGTLFGN